MGWAELLSAGAIGGLLVKTVDTLWIQRVVAERERRRWLREQRFVAYSELASELLQMGVWRGTAKLDEVAAATARAALIAADHRVSGRIREWFDDLVAAKNKYSSRDLFFREFEGSADLDYDEREALWHREMMHDFERLHTGARNLVQTLMRQLASE